jgi:hypothetical protein
MPAGAIIEDLAEVRMKLDRACERLTVASAESLDDSSEDLDSAVRQLADCQARLMTQAGNPAALEEAWRVRRTFVRARMLLHKAAAFHGNWTRVRGAMSGGYTRTGEPEAVRHTGRVFLRA